MKNKITKEQAKENLKAFRKELKDRAWKRVAGSKIPDLVKVGLLMSNALSLLTAQIDVRIRAAYERKRRLAQLEEDRRFDEELKKRIGIVAGFVLTDGDIEISPLKTVNDFYCEGSALHHCVFANGYYKRKDCLILGAKVNGERTETIEVNLKDFSVSQCRGKNNMDSPYHKRIMSLMSSNLGRIRDMYRRAQ